MAIDSRLYEKYSGRSGDPHARLGAALAQSSAQKSRRAAAKDRTVYERHLVSTFKVHWWMSVIGSIVVGGVVLYALI